MFLFAIVLSIIACGTIGGVANFYLEDTSADPTLADKSNRFRMLRNIFIGTVAAALTPLFLEMVSSSLLEKIQTALPAVTKDLFIFIGFCLIASISAKRFIQSLTDKVISQLNEVQRKQEEQAAVTDAVLDANTQPTTEGGDVPPVGGDGSQPADGGDLPINPDDLVNGLDDVTRGDQSRGIESLQKLSPAQRIIALFKSNRTFAFRSDKAIATATKMQLTEVQVALLELEKQGNARKFMKNGEALWTLTRQGWG